jgi:hypothetical protein
MIAAGKAMNDPIRMPFACPDCQKSLYSVMSLRPPLRAPRRAIALYIVAGTVTSLTYLVLLLVLREWLKEPIGPVFGNKDIVLYHVPPTRLLSIVALPVALVPGLGIGWVASRLPNVRRLRCRTCGWSATFPAAAIWTDPPSERSRATLSQAFDVIVNDTNPWEECAVWALAEIREGRLPEDVEADLVAQGWPPDDVAGMVERCRKEARQRRG